MNGHNRLAGDGRRGYSLIELLLVLAVFGILAAVALPVVSSSVSGLRVQGDAQALAYDIGLARMRAASNFTRGRLYIDLSTGAFRVQSWQKTGTPGWVSDGSEQKLSPRVAFGAGSIATPPPNTQPALAQAPACRDDAGDPIANTSCFVFNSRGIPIDAVGAPTPTGAIYVTDGAMVYACTVAANGMPRVWWTPAGSVAWQKK